MVVHCVGGFFFTPSESQLLFYAVKPSVTLTRDEAYRSLGLPCLKLVNLPKPNAMCDGFTVFKVRARVHKAHRGVRPIEMAGCVPQSRLHGGLSLARDNHEEIKGWQPNHNHTNGW